MFFKNVISIYLTLCPFLLIRRAEREAAKNPAVASSQAALAPPPVAAQPAVKKDYSEAKLQIRQTNGQPLVHSFGAKESLAAVRLYVQMNR